MGPVHMLGLVVFLTSSGVPTSWEGWGVLGHQGGAQVLRHQHGQSRQAATIPSSGFAPYINSTQSHGLVAAMPAEDIRLSCSIFHLGNRTVSWVRHRDIHLLTAGKDSYTDDRRFSAHHPILSSHWQLRIKNVSKSDEGFYECQVSTSPAIGHRVQLVVVEPHLSIEGGPDLFINQGSFINLTCIATNLPGLPLDVHWFHKEKLVSYSGPRKGVSSIVEKGPQTVSQLLVQRATLADSGTYSCQPTYPANKHRAGVKELTATINLHILEGEFPAAIQGAPRLHTTSPLILLLILLS